MALTSNPQAEILEEQPTKQPKPGIRQLVDPGDLPELLEEQPAQQLKPGTRQLVGPETSLEWGVDERYVPLTADDIDLIDICADNPLISDLNIFERDYLAVDPVPLTPLEPLSPLSPLFPESPYGSDFFDEDGSEIPL